MNCKISIFPLALMALWLVFPTQGYPAEKKVDAGNVNWIEGYISATGYGTARASANKVADRIMARRAAVADAQRVLLETVKGVRIDSTSRVENMMLKEDKIVTQVSGVIQAAQLVKENMEWTDGAPLATVEMRLCLNPDRCTAGKSLLTALNLDSRNEPPHVPPQRFTIAPAPEASTAQATQAPPATPENPVPPQVAAPANKPIKVEAKPRFYPFDNSKPVTGVIVDLEGRFFERELMPVVATFGEDKTPFTVYSAKYVNPKVIRTYGVIRYAESVEQGKKNPQIGDNVLVIPAENITKENMIIIHRDSAHKIRETISHGNDYLSEAKVIIADK
jgi:hypothetical protein